MRALPYKDVWSYTIRSSPVKLATLNIEQFGARSNVRLSGLSDQLNVVYGPNGSGKSTIINFISWVLYGVRRDSSPRYFESSLSKACGTIEYLDAGNPRVVRRQDDGTHGGRVSLESGRAYGTSFQNARITGVDLDEFQTVFSFGFDQPPAIDRLVRTTIAHGFDLSSDECHHERIRQLAEQLNRQRAEIAKFPHVELSALAARREAIHREISAIEQQSRQRQLDAERQRSELKAELSKLRSELMGIQGWLRDVEAKIQSRRQQLDSAIQEDRQAQDAYSQSRRQKIEEIDAQLQQWNNVLDSIRQRIDAIRSKMVMRDGFSAGSLVDDDSDLRCIMRSLGYQLDDIVDDFHPPYACDSDVRQRHEHEYLRSVVGTALHAMRDDVSRLSSELQRFKSIALHNEYESELKNLGRCEQELNVLIESLSKRRDSLILPVHEGVPFWYGEAAEQYESWKTDPAHPSNGSIIRPWYETNGGHTRGYIYYPVGSISRAVDPVLEARLNHLHVRREEVMPRVRELESRIRDIENRLSHLNHIGSDGDRIESLRRELAEIETRERQADQYASLQRAIRMTEEELSRARSEIRASSITLEASAILKRLTNGSFVRIQIGDGHHVWCQDAQSRLVNYDQLNRGTRDQAYLALAMALVAAYKRRGIEQPMVLNDVFVNVDASRAESMAAVLYEFASHGHQVILFTRQEHVSRLFGIHTCKRFTLGESVTSEAWPFPPTAPHMESVRRPQVEPRVTREANYEWVTRWNMPHRATQPVTSAASPAKIVESIPARQLDDVPVLGLGSRLDSIPSIDPILASRCADIGIVTVGQFLEFAPDDVADRLHGEFQPIVIQRFQSEIALRAYIQLSPLDARVLVDCGIDDPEELAICDVAQLQRRIIEYLSTGDIRQRLGITTQFDAELLAGWIEMARRSNYRRRQAHYSRTYRRSREASNDTDSRTVPAHKLSYARSSRVPEAKRRATTENRKVAARPQKAPVAKTVSPSTGMDADGSYRFYLDLSDPIVEAPSIGPKTAERFNEVGVVTIADFLALDPTEGQEKISYRRITAEIIAEWQLQSRLVCQIPNLRGHDAQILVACSVASAEDLSRADASTLFKQVKRFCNTTEGKRVLRSGKKPDLKEVSAWIEWAQHARELQMS